MEAKSEQQMWQPSEAQYNAAWKWIESDASEVQQVRKKLSIHEFRQIMKGIVLAMASELPSR